MARPRAKSVGGKPRSLGSVAKQRVLLDDLLSSLTPRTEQTASAADVARLVSSMTPVQIPRRVVKRKSATPPKFWKPSDRKARAKAQKQERAQRASKRAATAAAATVRVQLPMSISTSSSSTRSVGKLADLLSVSSSARSDRKLPTPSFPTSPSSRKPKPTSTASRKPKPTSTASRKPKPTSPSSRKPKPTSTASRKPKPTSPSSRKPKPTSTASRKPKPTSPSSRKPKPTSTASRKPKPTSPSSRKPKPTSTASRKPKPTPTASRKAPIPVAAPQVLLLPSEWNMLMGSLSRGWNPMSMLGLRMESRIPYAAPKQAQAQVRAITRLGASVQRTVDDAERANRELLRAKMEEDLNRAKATMAKLREMRARIQRDNLEIDKSLAVVRSVVATPPPRRLEEEIVRLKSKTKSLSKDLSKSSPQQLSENRLRSREEFIKNLKSPKSAIRAFLRPQTGAGFQDPKIAIRNFLRAKSPSFSESTGGGAGAGNYSSPARSQPRSQPRSPTRTNKKCPVGQRRVPPKVGECTGVIRSRCKPGQKFDVVSESCVGQARRKCRKGQRFVRGECR
jgi:hypothetical protein